MACRSASINVNGKSFCNCILSTLIYDCEACFAKLITRSYLSRERILFDFINCEKKFNDLKKFFYIIYSHKKLINFNKKNKEGNTPLHYVMLNILKYNNYEKGELYQEELNILSPYIVLQLNWINYLLKGANYNIKNNCGKTPLDYDTLAFLKEEIAKI